jgi:very-short-patch-repair endonuclease
LIDASRVPSNGRSHDGEFLDLTGFTPAVRKSLLKFHLLREEISIAPIIRKIIAWDSPPEQAFYVSFLYLANVEVIDPMIRIVEQYPISSGMKTYRVDFLLSLVDHLQSYLPPITILVECDSGQFHDSIVERSTDRCQRSRVIERQGTKLYRFSGTEVLKNPESCVIECARDLQRLVVARREIVMQAFDKGLFRNRGSIIS